VSPAAPTRLGVCSWSLRARSPRELVERVRATGLNAVQLWLDPIRSGAWGESETRRDLDRAGIDILSGMMAMAGEDYSSLESIARTGGVRPDSTWGRNLAAAEANADLARRLGLTLVTFHVGFIPHEPSERATILARAREIVAVFRARGVRTAFETGQERADTLLEVLRELAGTRVPGVGVNFDPANMILYGMGDPIASLRALAPHVLQCHIKDARLGPAPGQWGTEVPAGTGAVDWPAFFRTLRESGLQVNLAIEREAGENRLADVMDARALVAPLMREQLGVSP